MIFSVVHPPMSGPGLQLTIPLCEWSDIAGCVMNGTAGAHVQGIEVPDGAIASRSK